MVLADLLFYALTIFLLLMFFRLIMEYVFLFKRDFRPSGPFLIPLEIAYTATDPPLKALRRVLPPLRIGGFSLDLGFLLLFIAVNIARGVVGGLRG